MNIVLYVANDMEYNEEKEKKRISCECIKRCNERGTRANIYVEQRQLFH